MKNRIKELRRHHNFTQIELCKRLGVTQGALSGWENGRYEPDISALTKMAQIFDVTVDYLLGGENDSFQEENRKSVKIPVLGLVQAGIPVEAVEDILDYEEITPEMARQGDFFALQVRGESMEPRISEGDVVIVRKQPTVDSGQIAVALVGGNDATVKKLVKHREGISLVPFNTNFEPLFFTNREVEELPVTILGKVVELRAKF